MGNNIGNPVWPLFKVVEKIVVPRLGKLHVMWGLTYYHTDFAFSRSGLFGWLDGWMDRWTCDHLKTWNGCRGEKTTSVSMCGAIWSFSHAEKRHITRTRSFKQGTRNHFPAACLHHHVRERSMSFLGFGVDHFGYSESLTRQLFFWGMVRCEVFQDWWPEWLVWWWMGVPGGQKWSRETYQKNKVPPSIDSRIATETL